MGDEIIFTDDAYDIIDAIDTLHIPVNKGGRVQFIKSYPAIAREIFGEALYTLDTEGRGDRKALHDLEDAAETRRFNTAYVLRTVQDKPDINIQAFYPIRFLHNTETLTRIFTPYYADKLNAFFATAEAPAEVIENIEKAAFETNTPTLMQSETMKNEAESISSKISVKAPSVDISKVMKDGTNIGKDILSDLQNVAEDYTPVVRKAFDGLRDTLQKTAKDQLKKAKNARRTKHETPIPPVAPKPKPKAQPKPKTPDVFLAPSSPKPKKQKSNATSWHDFVAQSQSVKPSPSEKRPIDEHTIKGAIDIEYDTTDYTYLYAPDGYDKKRERKPVQEASAKISDQPKETINPNTIADYTWGAPLGKKTIEEQPDDITENRTFVHNALRLGETFLVTKP